MVRRGFAAAALVLVACGGVVRVAPTEGDPVVSLDLELCRFLERCHPELLTLFQGGSAAACEDWAACVDPHQDWKLRLADPDGCVSFVHDATCDDVGVLWEPAALGGVPSIGPLFFDTGLACVAPARGTPAVPGGACLSNAEGDCSADDYCAIDSPDHRVGTGFCGTCTPLAPDGAACTDEVICANGEHCIDSSCQVPLPAGATCTTDEQCQDYNCEYGTCVDFPSLLPSGVIDSGDAALGLSCNPYDPNDPCQTPFTACVNGTCVPRPDAGEPCDPDVGGCRIGQTCDDGVCVAGVCNAKVGQPCGVTCETGASCDPDTLLCARPPSLGEACTGSCAAPYRCSFEDGVCYEPHANGDPCKQSSDCASEFCDRDYSACTHDYCSLPACDEDCGVCADAPTRAACE